MRILHIIASIDLKCGGTSTVCRELAAAQGKAGHSVSIGAYGPDDDYAARSGVRYIELPMPGWPEPFFARGLRGRLARIVADSDICHIHGMWEGLSYEGSLACNGTGKPYVHSPHGMLDSWALSVRRIKKQAALALGFAKIPQHAAAILVSNLHEQDCIVRSGRNRRVELVPHGVNLAALDSGMLTESKAGSISVDSPYILFLGRLHTVKGLGLLTRAFARIASEFPEHKLILAGPDGGDGPALVELIKALNLKGRVLMPGPLWGDAKARAMNGAACFCLLSEHENFGLSLAEAMGCRCPVIASTECHFDDIVKAGAGLIVDRTTDAAASAMRTILQDPAAAAAMGLRGRQLIESSFTWPAISVRLTALFEQLLARGK